MLAAAIITLSGIPFCVFIGQCASHCGHNCLADKILGCDQLDILALSVGFCCDRCCNFRIEAFNV